jgi:thymidylate synthase ThyX
MARRQARQILLESFKERFLAAGVLRRFVTEMCSQKLQMTQQIKAKLILASQNVVTKIPLYTFVLTYPRMILAEVNSHRMLSRNTASSRAVPARIQRERIINDPFVPLYIGLNQRGMQAGEELTGLRRALALGVWKSARYPVAAAHWALQKLGVHKQVTNRLIEPWMWCEQIVTATDLKNLFKLRANTEAEPHFQILAQQMQQELQRVSLQPLEHGEWHLPFIDDEDRHQAFLELRGELSTLDVLKMVSAARCARVSYSSPDVLQTGHSISKDFNLAARLVRSGHWSPFEHQATPMHGDGYWWGNLRGWKQFRKEFSKENGEHS